MYKSIILLASFVICSTIVTAQENKATTTQDPIRDLTVSMFEDPAWQSVMSVAGHATGKEGAAYSSWTGLRTRTNLSPDEFVAEAESLFTQLPTQLQSFQLTYSSLLMEILTTRYPYNLSTWTSTPTDSSTPSFTDITTSFPAPTNTATTTGSLASSSTAVAVTGGAMRVEMIGYIAAIGAVGVGALLL